MEVINEMEKHGDLYEQIPNAKIIDMKTISTSFGDLWF